MERIFKVPPGPRPPQNYYSLNIKHHNKYLLNQHIQTPIHIHHNKYSFYFFIHNVSVYERCKGVPKKKKKRKEKNRMKNRKSKRKPRMRERKKEIGDE
jgi:hypothetical protein